MADTDWVEEVLGFWFAELTREDWWSGDTTLDERIRTRFLGLYEKMKAGVPAEAARTPRGALAAVILFDQMPRNMFRGTAEAFATDDLANRIAREALDQGLDAGMNADERAFLYMPLMHSEILSDQERCVALFRALGNEENLRYAIEHRDIIADYGRFPHRNRPLGRESTPAELEFLGRHKGYGQ